jgi:hypothetical protein
VTEESDKKPDLSPEAEALKVIAQQVSAYRKEHRKPKPMYGLSPSAVIQQLTGIDPAEARERERDRREREQAKLYKLVVLIAAVSAFASIASVVVAVVNG